MSAALSLVFIDQTAISVALPSIQREFNLSYTKVQWIINAYALVLVSTLIISGRLSDIITHRNTYLMGILLFCIMSLMCGYATTIDRLLLARCLQGLSGALMIPAASVIVVSSFPEEKRGRAMGIYVGLASIFLSVGPFIGGYVTETFGWRWVFWVNIPIGFTGFVFALFTVPKRKAVSRQFMTDFPGFITLLCTIVPFIFATIESVNRGIFSWLIIGLLLFSVTSFFVFIFIEKRVEKPLVDLTLFQNKIFSTCSYITLQDQFCLSMVVFFMLFLQYVIALTPTLSGLLLMTVTLPIFITAPLAGYLRDKIGFVTPIRLGIVLLAIGLLWIAIVNHKHNAMLLIPGFICVGAGAPFVLTISLTTALNSVAFSQRGAASGIIATFKHLGIVSGIAILGSVIGHFYHTKLAHFLQTNADYQQLSVADVDGILAGTVQTKTAIAHLSTAAQEQLVEGARAAYQYGFTVAAVFALIIVFLTIGWTVCFSKHIQRKCNNPA